MIGSQPTALAAITAPRPTAPRPKTMIPSPAFGSSTLSTLPAPVWSPHPSGQDLERQVVRDLDGVVGARDRVRPKRLAEQLPYTSSSPWRIIDRAVKRVPK
jgi:hypothetical protein